MARLIKLLALQFAKSTIKLLNAVDLLIILDIACLKSVAIEMLHFLLKSMAVVVAIKFVALIHSWYLKRQYHHQL